MTDEAELNAAMNQWDPVPSPETRRKIFRGVFGTDDLSKVDIAAAFDAIDLFKRVAEKDAAAIAEVNKYLKAA